MSPLTSSALCVLSLGLVAGYVDAVGYVELHGVFTAAMTGNSTTFGISLASGNHARARSVGIVLGLFFIGALGASLLRRALPAYRHEWLCMAGVLIVAQAIHWARPMGVGAHGETFLLVFAMAMQAEALSRFSGVSVQTIVVTNNIVKFADNVAGFLCSIWQRKPELTRSSFLPGLGWAGCIVGAFLSVGAQNLTSGFFLMPVPLLLGLFFLQPGQSGPSGHNKSFDASG